METLHTTSPSSRWPEFSPSNATAGNVSPGLSLDRRWTALGLVILGLLALGITAATAIGFLVWQRGRLAMVAAERERAAAMAAMEAQRRQAAAASENPIAAAPAAAGTSSLGAPGTPGAAMGEEGRGMGGGGYGAGFGAPAGFVMPGSMPVADMIAARQQLEAQIAPLVQRLREAQSDDQKTVVMRQLTSILEGYFDQDMQRRLQELTEIETRVQRLKQQCDQRQKAKEQIIGLQLRVLDNEAAGLGFFGAQAPAAASDAYSGMMGGPAGMPGGFGSGMMPGMGGMMGMGMESMGGMGMGMQGMGGTRGMGSAMGSASGAQVPAPFLKRTALDFNETPLQEVCDWLCDESGTNIYLDPQALKEKGVDAQSPVTLNVRDISVAGALELLADHFSDTLGVRFEDGVGMITHRDYATERPETDGWPASQRAASLLSKPADYSLQDLPLADALGYLRDAAQVDVFLNRRSMEKTGISPDSPVSLNFKGVPHRTALKLMLHNLDRSLYFALVDGVVVVAAKEIAIGPFAPPSPGTDDPFGSAPPSAGNPFDSAAPAASNAAATPPAGETPAKPAEDPAAAPPPDDGQE